MRKILLSIVTVAVISSLAVGATRAYFTNDLTISQVTIATGTLHIRDMQVDWMQNVTFTGLKPGDLVRKWLRIENDGTLDVGTLTVSAVNKNGDNLLGQLNGWTYGTIAGTTDDPDGVQTGYNTNAELLLSSQTLLSAGNPVLHPGQHTTIQVQFVVPTTMDDTWQGKTETFDLLFHAEQVH